MIHWINIPITLLSARNSQMETFWRPKYLDSQPCITPNKPEPPKLPLESQKKGKRRTKIEREIMISVSHLIRKKLKTEDIILENSSESLDLGSHRSYLYVQTLEQLASSKTYGTDPMRSRSYSREGLSRNKIRIAWRFRWMTKTIYILGG